MAIKESRTISELVNAISEEMMTRLDYKPTVLKQYHIVWNKLCKRAGVQPANDFDMEFGMKFLDEAMRAHPKHLNENSKHRWIKAIYTLADFKRTGILSLRREKRGFVFSELAKPAFQQFTAHRPLDYPKRTYATRAFIWSVSRNTWSNNAWRTLQDLTTGMYKGSLMVWPYTNYPRSDAARKQKCLRLTRQTRSSVWSTASTGETREAKKETR